MWILVSYLSVGLYYGSNEEYMFVTMAGFILMAVGFIFLLRSILFSIHDLNASLINIKEKIHFIKSSIFNNSIL